MRFKTLLLAAVAAAILVAHAMPFSQQAVADTQAAENLSSVPRVEAESLWFIELSNAPVAAGGGRAQLRAEQAQFRAAAANASIEFAERFAYSDLWNGFSVRATPASATALRNMPGVKAIYPVEQIPLEVNVEDSVPNLTTALGMTGASAAQAAGFTGAGIRVGVIDSGIDYHHPDLGGCFGPNCRVTVGWDFVGDAYDSGVGSPAIPDSDPDDCPGPEATNPNRPQAGGHGTHVAGIVGASGNPADGGALGVAPDVTFGAYRVFGCSGSSTADVIIAAMERALADGMDVVNMSLGASFQWPQYPTAVAADNLVRNGVAVITSFGNSGSSGLYSGSAPGVADSVIAVGAVNNTHAQSRFFRVTPDNGAVAFNQASGAPLAPTSGSLPMARTGTTASTADACNANAPAPASLDGRAALVRRGGCTFHEKALNAQLAGAAAVVIYNNAAGTVTPTVAGNPAITIPVVSITQAAGVVLNNRIAAGTVTLTWHDGTVSVPVAGGGLTSSFSSWGQTPDLQLKPDITAPGGAIRSTYPLGFGGYAVISGTSMASPHVAGAVAQLLEARPGMSPVEVRTALQNTASPILWWGAPSLGFLDQVHRQGAGMLRIADAINAPSSVTPAKVSLGESTGEPRTVTLRVRNGTAEPVTYTVHHEPALATGPNTFAIGNFLSFAGVSFGESEFIVPAGAQHGLDVTFADPPSLDNSLYGGYIVLTPDDGGQVLRVPYGGFRGDYQSLRVLEPLPFGFPWLAQVVGTQFVNRPNGATFTMQGNDIPFFLLHAAHQSRRLQMTVTDADTGRNWHRFVDFEYIRRNAANVATLPDFFFSFGWDGTTANPSGRRMFTVPNGNYIVEIRVQKALGTPEDVEVWTSPVITIARP